MTHYKNYSFLLLSDTTSSNTNMIKNCLENLGCKIILSHNSENYQTVIANRQISGILIDFKISGNSCINICKDLKSRTKNNAIPLIIYNVIDDDDVIASLTDMDLIDIFMQNLNEKELTHRLKVMLKLISSMMNLKHKKDYIKCIENTSDLLVVKMNSNFRFSEWNRTFKNFIGGKQSDLAKIYFDHLVHPENKKQIMSALSRILKNQNRISETFLMKSADGYRPTEWTFMASGHSIMASGQDVSNNRHNAEQQLISNSILKESESICQYTFWIFNPETNVIFFNRSMDFLNNTRRLKLDDFIRTFIKSDRKRLSDAFSGLRDQKENFDISCKQISRDQLKYFYLRGFRKISHNRNPAFLGIIQDISRFNEMSHELILQKSFLEKTDKVGQLGRWTSNMHGGPIIMSRQLHDMIGWERDIPKSPEDIADIIHPGDQNRFRDYIKKFRADPDNHHVFECVILLKDGKEKHVRAYTELFMDQDTGRPRSIQGIIQDISDLKTYQKNLRKEEKKYHVLFSKLGNPHLLCDVIRDDSGKAVDLKIVEANTAFCNMIDIPSRDYIGKQFLHPEKIVESSLVTNLVHISLSGKEFTGENYYPKLEKWFNIHIYSPSKDKIIWSFTDISLMKKTEVDLMKKNRFSLAVNEIMKELVSGKNYKNIMLSTVYRICSETGVTGSGIFRVDKDSGHIIKEYNYTKKKESFFDSKNHLKFGTIKDISPLLEHNGMLIIDNIKDPKHSFFNNFIAGLRRTPVRSLLYTPIRINNTLWGFFGIHYSGIAHHWTEDEISLIQNIALSLNNYMEREQKKSELQKEKKRLQIALRMNDMVEWEYDVFQKKWYLNQNYFDFAEKFFDPVHPDHEIPVFSYIHRDEREKVRSDFSEFIRGNSSLFQTVFRIEGKNGLYKWVYTIADVLERDSEGNPAIVSGVFQNITREYTQRRKLEINQERLRQTSMLAGIGYWDYDSDSRSFTFSPEASRILFGCEKETVASFNDYTSMILKEFRQDYVKQFAKKHKQTYSSQKYSLKTRDSRTRNIHEIRIDNFSSDGDYLSSRGVLQDITRLESINEALKQSEARLTSAVAGVKLGIWEYDHSTNIFKTNKTWFSMLEYDTMEKPEISRNAWENLLHPDDRNAVVKFFEKFIRRDVPVYDTKYRMRSNDGHYKWIHSFARRTGDPEEKTIIGFHLDVSESITQYQNLELINTLVETTQDAFYIVDSKGCIRFANKAACSMLKYDIKSLLSMHIQDLDMQKKIKSTKGYTDLWKSRKPGIQYSFRTRHKTSDGKTIPVEAHLVHRKINNEMLSFSIVSDITDRLKEEKELIHARKEAESANIAKSRFISGISHEIRTPLNAIIGYSNLLSDELKDPDYIDYVKSIYMAGKNLLALINNVLDLSKIEADKIKLSRKPVQIIELLQELETIFRIKTEKKGLDFILDTPRNAPYLHLDKVRMQQVITNLIENAIKFTSEGYIKVTLQFRQVLGLPCTVMISVRDTGIGIPAKNIKKIFNSFEQSDNGVELSHSGSGLGLAISKQLTEMMGGTLNCKSIVGKGSIFTVTLNGVKSFNYKGSLGMEEIEPNSHEIINFANKKKSDSLKLPKNISTADRDSLKNLICQLDSGISVSQGHALSVKLKKLGQIYDSSSLTKTSEKLTSALNTFDMVQIEKIIKICNKAIF